MRQRRIELPEAELAALLTRITARCRAGLPAAEAAALRERDAREEEEMRGWQEGGTHAGEQAATGREALPGRQTGSVEWRRERGELGMEGQGREEGGGASEGPRGSQSAD